MTRGILVFFLTILLVVLGVGGQLTKISSFFGSRPYYYKAADTRRCVAVLVPEEEEIKTKPCKGFNLEEMKFIWVSPEWRPTTFHRE